MNEPLRDLSADNPSLGGLQSPRVSQLVQLLAVGPSWLRPPDLHPTDAAASEQLMLTGALGSDPRGHREDLIHGYNWVLVAQRVHWVGVQRVAGLIPAPPGMEDEPRTIRPPDLKPQTPEGTS